MHTKFDNVRNNDNKLDKQKNIGRRFIEKYTRQTIVTYTY